MLRQTRERGAAIVVRPQNPLACVASNPRLDGVSAQRGTEQRELDLALFSIRVRDKPKLAGRVDEANDEGGVAPRLHAESRRAERRLRERTTRIPHAVERPARVW